MELVTLAAAVGALVATAQVVFDMFVRILRVARRAERPREVAEQDAADHEQHASSVPEPHAETADAQARAGDLLIEIRIHAERRGSSRNNGCAHDS
jgi:hypothetical protein